MNTKRVYFCYITAVWLSSNAFFVEFCPIGVVV